MDVISAAPGTTLVLDVLAEDAKRPLLQDTRAPLKPLAARYAHRARRPTGWSASVRFRPADSAPSSRRHRLAARDRGARDSDRPRLSSQDAPALCAQPRDRGAKEGPADGRAAPVPRARD